MRASWERSQPGLVGGNMGGRESSLASFWRCFGFRRSTMCGGGGGAICAVFLSLALLS